MLIGVSIKAVVQVPNGCSVIGIVEVGQVIRNCDRFDDYEGFVETEWCDNKGGNAYNCPHSPGDYPQTESTNRYAQRSHQS